jgi:DNA invertase Pin-like site-specific DNA recombinase
MGAEPDRIYLDQGFTGSDRPRPKLREALAAVREGDTLAVTGLERLARSLSDANDILQRLAEEHVVIKLGDRSIDLSTPEGAQLIATLSLIVDFEAALARGRVIEGMNLARVKGRLKGRAPKLAQIQQGYVVELFNSGNYTVAEIASLMSVGRSTVYRTVQRAERARANGLAGSP